ncbi:Sugar kinase of the NBD/HSP70 family, may contain an N-terminal HTH domain [Mucilaginibacter mallensis]|uniref:Sugar kinase of the NBD/HSP70 family, may contain an N-terminal HTH domain n=1 Tax=Mucilaginibacter mallensis TaxID=652787 RepID=A0A1H1PHI3_MUCMA|nr:ROK family protein [Mucilaginibacter mallensis]SDS10738.1 Sugar kinase of the NBD/HSP70 family, may contain an N-terminal HTH domain [Mucilaginibacter mallensis]
MELKPKFVKSTELKNMIVKRLYFDKALSCADLSELFDKSVPSISKAVNELIDEGFVIENGYAPSSGGRRPLVYSIRPEAMYILTVAMDQLSTRIQMVDLVNRPVADIAVCDLKLLNNPHALATLIGHINSYINTTGIPKDKIAGTGIGMPGFINSIEGVNFTYMESGDQSLTQVITIKTGIPTYIDNDSSLIALAEQKFGIAKARKDVMVINLGWGIGLGMIINGEIYRGHNGFAGEFSHIPLSEDGALCTCGKRGCLEAEASMLVVAEKAIRGIKKGNISSLKNINIAQSKMVGDAIMEAANSGDQFAIELLSDAGYKIGKALAILIHIMNPASIVLSGRGAVVGKILLAPIQQALNKYCIPRLANSTELLISDLGFNAELIGAAVLVMENFDKEIKNHLITTNQSSMEKTMKN